MKDIYSKIDKERNYNLDEAIDLIKNSPAAKFEETLDIAINLSLNAGKTDQSVRGAINLPHGTGKNIRIAVVAKDENASKARESGADIVGHIASVADAAGDTAVNNDDYINFTAAASPGDNVQIFTDGNRWYVRGIAAALGSDTLFHTDAA